MNTFEQERLLVLKMLEEGKISADDAVKLIESLKSNTQRFEFSNDDMNEKLSRFSQAVDSFAKDFSGKVESVTKDMEPKLKKATKIVVEKTASIIDEISKNLNETLKNLDVETEVSPCECECDCECEDKCDDEPKEN